MYGTIPGFQKLQLRKDLTTLLKVMQDYKQKQQDLKSGQADQLVSVVTEQF